MSAGRSEEAREGEGRKCEEDKPRGVADNQFQLSHKAQVALFTCVLSRFRRTETACLCYTCLASASSTTLHCSTHCIHYIHYSTCYWTQIWFVIQMNCLQRCADACCRASFFFSTSPFYYCFALFLFLFSCSKLPTSTTPQEFTSCQCTRLVPRCVYVFHGLLVCVCVFAWESLCICEFGFQYIYCLVCFLFEFGSLIIALSLSRSFAIFALKKPNTFCVLFCYYYLCVSVEDWRLADCCQLHILSVHTIMPCAVLCEFLASICWLLFLALTLIYPTLPLPRPLLCCRYSFLLYAHFQMTSSLALLCHCSTHTQTNAHTYKLSLILCYALSVKQYQPRSLARSLSLTHSMCCVRPRSLRAYSPRCHSFSFAQRRLRFAIKASRIERFHLSNFCVVVHATLGVFWLFLNHRKQKIVEIKH